MGGFRDILGNEEIKKHFQEGIRAKRISHSYIIHGEKGMGKRTVAKAFAMTLLCEAGGDEPCMECHSCKQCLSDNNPDIIYLQHEKPNLISVDEVRSQLVSDITLKPYSYNYKVYIIQDAQLMNVQAQNAMLKTIEEPPEYAVILLLTTNLDSLLPTVLSRCVTMNMQPLRTEVIKEQLMKHEKIVDYQADLATSFAGGNLGRAKDLVISQEFMEMQEEVVQLMRYIKDMQAYEVVAAVKRASEYKYTVQEYLDLMLIWFRDVLLYKASMDVNGLIFKSELKTIKQQAATSSYAGIEAILKGIDRAKIRLESKVNFDITIELLFLTIRENI